MEPIGPKSDTAHNRLSELDAFRGIAAMLVVCFHFTWKRTALDVPFMVGVSGVDLFFIISGFVILLTLERSKHWTGFVVNRFSRLYPAYWVCITFTTAVVFIYSRVMPDTPPVTLQQYLANFTMFQSYIGEADIDGTYWTLIVEMLFYAFMFIVFMVGALRYVEAIAAVVLAGLVALALPGGDYGTMWRIAADKVPLIEHFPLFTAGIVFYRIRYSGATTLRYALLIACYAAQLFFFFRGGRSAAYIVFPAYALMITVYFGLFVLFIRNEASWLVNRVTLFLGSISYSLYLIHQYLGMKVIIPGLMTFANVPFWIAFPLVALPITITLAWFVTRFVEKPAMAWVRSVYRRISPASST